MSLNKPLLFIISIFLATVLCFGNATTIAQPRHYQVKILATEAHDPKTFTQGFELHDDWFYESSGLYGQSRIFRYNANDAEVAAQTELNKSYFAEGLTLLDNKVFLLTWQEGKAFVYNKDSLKLLKSFNYEGEGWGLTHDGENLIMSDGSATLTFRSPRTFEVINTIEVASGNKSWDRINELEFVDGVIWANQWQENTVLGIDAVTGDVIGLVDISELSRKAAVSPYESVANGIAYDQKTDAFWLTGKYWRFRYLVKFVSSDDQ